MCLPSACSFFFYPNPWRAFCSAHPVRVLALRAHGCSRPSVRLVFLACAQEDVWTQAHQQQLEKALGRFPMGMDKNERWASISAAVPGKSKKQCIERFKLVKTQLLAKKKAEKKAAAEAVAANGTGVANGNGSGSGEPKKK